MSSASTPTMRSVYTYTHAVCMYVCIHMTNENALHLNFASEIHKSSVAEFSVVVYRLDVAFEALHDRCGVSGLYQETPNHTM